MAKIPLLILLACLLPALATARGTRGDNNYKCNFLESKGDGVYAFDDQRLNGKQFSVTFEVLANSDVRVALSPVKEEHDGMYVISIGGPNNDDSTITKNGDVLAVYSMASGARESELQCRASCMNKYWICFEENMLSVGRGGESEAFLTYNVNSDSSFDPEYVGFTTGSGVGMFGNIRAHDSCLAIQESFSITSTAQPRGCADVDCGGVECKWGFKKNERGCMTCECKTSPCSPLSCSSVCENGYEVDDNGCYTCECKSGPCDSQPCQNSGYCVAANTDAYQCLCLNGFTGTNCEKDEIPPVIKCPENMEFVADPGAPFATVTYERPEASDNAGPPRVECKPDMETLGIGNNDIICKAIDAAGNEESCTYIIRVIDEEKPSITCPVDMSAPTDEGKPTSSQEIVLATATDNDGSEPTVECSDDNSSLELGQNIITCKATDGAGNSIDCQYTITVTDEEKPSITCPVDMTVPADEGKSTSSQEIVPATATDNDGNEPAVECSDDNGSLALGENIITCTATDGAGNSIDCQYTITVTDVVAPTVNCPQPMVVAVPSNTLWEIPTAVDDDGSSPEVTCNPSNPASMVYTNGVNTITCEATDNAGNRGECSFTVTLQPEECRFPTLAGDVFIYKDCATPLTADGLSKICYRLAAANDYNVFVGIWNKQSESVQAGMAELDVLKDETSVTGPVSGTKPTPGFGNELKEMCITRFPSSVLVTFNGDELWSVPFEPEDTTEIGFASSDDAEWIVQPYFGPQGSSRRRRSVEPNLLKKATTRRRRAVGPPNGGNDWDNQSDGDGGLRVMFNKFNRRRR